MQDCVAGRSLLRLATFALPTHREVVATALRITAMSPPKGSPAPVRVLRVCVPRRREPSSHIVSIREMVTIFAGIATF
jgi:hypothetical protein